MSHTPSKSSQPQTPLSHAELLKFYQDIEEKIEQLKTKCSQVITKKNNDQKELIKSVEELLQTSPHHDAEFPISEREKFDWLEVSNILDDLVCKKTNIEKNLSSEGVIAGKEDKFDADVRSLLATFPDIRLKFSNNSNCAENCDDRKENIKSIYASWNEQLSFFNNIILLLAAGFLGFAYKAEIFGKLRLFADFWKEAPILFISASIFLGLCCAYNRILHLRHKYIYETNRQKFHLLNSELADQYDKEAGITAQPSLSFTKAFVVFWYWFFKPRYATIQHDEFCGKNPAAVSRLEKHRKFVKELGIATRLTFRGQLYIFVIALGFYGFPVLKTNYKNFQPVPIRLSSGNLYLNDDLKINSKDYTDLIDDNKSDFSDHPNDTTLLFNSAILTYFSNDLLLKANPKDSAAYSNLQTGLKKANLASDLGMDNIRLRVLTAHIYRDMVVDSNAWPDTKTQMKGDSTKVEILKSYKQNSNHLFLQLEDLDKQNAVFYKDLKLN